MGKENLILVNPEVDKEPLLLEFKENIPVGNKDQIVCEISFEQAYKMLEHSGVSTYFDDNIYIPLDVKEFLLKKKNK